MAAVKTKPKPSASKAQQAAAAAAVVVAANDQKTGRPTKFTPARVAKILRLAELAPSNQSAIARASAIDDQTLSMWLERGRLACEDNPDPVEAAFFVFFSAFEEAQVQAELIAERRILKAGEDPKYWTANAWYLERRRPQIFGRPTRLELSGPEGKPIEISAEDRSARLRTIILAALQSGAGLESLGLPALPAHEPE